ncbi:MAG TPA: LytTR family DNA-binding domain-containing protein [Nitrospiraceae bacterium]|nr:LytTR family DNA-binding domain-containing protein [Nitrospiraceae bacterium]
MRVLQQRNASEDSDNVITDVERVRAAILDTDHGGREHIRSLLANQHDFHVVVEGSGSAEALASIADEKPDIVFLDVQSLTGGAFEFLESMSRDGGESPDGDGSWRPAFVIVTAAEESAVKAFDVRALDFLLKPVNRTRFEITLTRVRHHVQQSRRNVGSVAFDGRAQSNSGRHVSHVLARSGERLLFVRLADVDWIEAAGNYVRVHARGDSLLVRASMAKAERRLDSSAFVRIHRSAIVNIDRIKDLIPWAHGEYIVTLQDGTRLQASRLYSRRLTEVIESCVL